MNSYIKIYFTLLVLVFSVFSAYATNYYTSTSGVFGTGSNWVSGTSPGTNSISKYGGTNDTVFVRDAMTIPSGFTVQGPEMILIIESGGSITVSGTGYINGSQIIINEGGLLDFSGTYSTANGALDRTTVNGTMNIGGDINAAAGTWIIGENGSLNVNGNISNNDPDMNFTNNGSVYVKNNVQFFTGTWTNGENGTFRTEGTDVFIGSAVINNNGSMEFVNVENNTTWDGSFDCDGNAGTGSVDFGKSIDCSAICNGGGSSSCANNVPLPVEWLSIEATYFNGSVEIEWSTASETNNDFFVIEKSYDAKQWFVVGNKDGAGNSKDAQFYHFKDTDNKEGISYYRIAQVDFDGLTSYSSVVFVRIEAENEVKSSAENVFPNPSEGVFYITVNEADISAIEIYNLQKMSIPFKVENAGNDSRITILGSTKGYFTVMFTTKSGVVYKNIIVK